MLQISLAAARVNAEFSQMEAAQRVGITPKTLRGYEKGYAAIPGYVLRKLAKLYGIPEECIRLPIVDDGEYDEKEFFLESSTV